MDSYYMLVPITAKKEDWKHTTKLKEKDSLDIQEFSMGRKGSLSVRGRHIKTTAIDNGVGLLTHEEMLQYLKDNEEVI